MTTDAYKDSIGVKIEITLNYNLAGNTGVTFHVREPSGSMITWIPTVDDEANGVVSYITEESDLSQAGKYCIQPEINFTGKTYYGTMVYMNIEDKLA